MKNSETVNNNLIKGQFLPEDYQLPDKSKQFLKIEPGDNIIRFLSSPLTGYVFFTEDSKPVRRPYDESSPTLGDFSKKELAELKAKKNDTGEFEGSRHFWIALVWDRKSNTPKILEITQAKIIRPLISLVKDEDWGDPRNYDVNINREGTGKFDTEYAVNPKPHRVLSEDTQIAIQELEANGLLNLNAIWKGDYPFEKYLY